MTQRRSRGDARPYFDQHKDRWYVAVELGPGVGGKRRRTKVSGKTATEARKAARDLRAKVEAGLPITSARETTGAFVDWWMKQVLPGSVSEGTEETYERLLRLYVVPAVGHIPLLKLAPGDVTSMMKGLADRGLSPATSNQARKLLARALRRAMQEERVHRNVAAIVDGPKLRRKEGRSLTAEEAQRLLRAIQEDRNEAGYVLGLALGLRRGEVLGLRWEDVDIDGDAPAIRVRQQIQRRKGRGLVLTDLKTDKSRRTLDIPTQVAETLRTQRARQARERLAAGPMWTNDVGLVFTTPTGTPVDPDNYRHRLAKLTTGAGLGAWTTHELRHSAGSLLYAMGVPMKVISEVLGHSSERVTSDIYVHLMDEQRSEAAAAIGRALWA